MEFPEDDLKRISERFDVTLPVAEHIALWAEEVADELTPVIVGKTFVITDRDHLRWPIAVLATEVALARAKKRIIG
jgi:hypothetical protein